MMGSRGTRLLIRMLSGCLLALIAPVAAAAYGEKDSDWWAVINGDAWAATLDGETDLGASISPTFSDLVDNLAGGYSGGLEVGKGSWSALADVIYLNLSRDAPDLDPILLEPDLPIIAITSADFNGWVVQGGFGYYVWDARGLSARAFAGVRYFRLDLGLTAGIDEIDVIAEARIKYDKELIDGIAGIQGELRIDDNWFVPYYGDIGTGTSDLTWQVSGGIGYQLEWGQISLQYRYLAWELPKDQPLRNINFGGPMLMLSVNF